MKTVYVRLLNEGIKYLALFVKTGNDIYEPKSNQPIKKVKTIFKTFYIANLLIITAALLLPVIEYSGNLLLSYYAISIVLALTFCITFLFLNIWGTWRYKHLRTRFILIGSLFLLWIIWGTYQILYAYTHDIAL